MLTIRLSEYLKSKQIPFFLITSQGTRISRALAWAEQVDLSDLGNNNFYPTHMLLPHVSGLKADIPWNKIAETKVLVWAVHPTEVFTTFFPGTDRILSALGFPYSRLSAMLAPARRVAANQLFELMIERNSLLAMDAATSRGIRFFYPRIKSDIPLLPIPCPTIETNNIHNKLAEPDLSIAYFGRIDKFKYSALRGFVKKDLKSLAKKQTVNLHLIAEGPLLGRLLDDCIKSRIRAYNHGFLENSEARMLIKEKTHLAIAMGTAALDIAGTEHPCLIVDPAHHSRTYDQKKFRFVSEIEGYTLGECRDFQGYQPGLHTFEEILTIIRTNKRLGIDCASYVREHHDPENIFRRLIGLLLGSTLFASYISVYADKLRS